MDWKALFQGIPLFVLLLVSLAGCNLPEAGSPGLTDGQKITIGNSIISELRKQGYDVIKADPAGSKYTLKAMINGMPETMLLDSGASLSFIGEDVKTKYRLKEIRYYRNRKPVIKTAFDDEIEQSFPAIADTFRLGNTVFRPWPFIVSGESESGTLLGSDFLHFTSAVFISNPGVLLFTTSHTPAKMIAEIVKANGYAEIDLLMAESRKCLKIKRQFGADLKTLDSGVLLVPVVVEKAKGCCIIDTGAFSTSLKNTRIKKTIWQIKSYSDVYQEDAKGNRQGVDTILIDEFMIGNYPLARDTEVVYSEMINKDDLDSKDDSLPILGLIGVDILRRYNAVIDFGNRKLYLQR